MTPKTLDDLFALPATPPAGVGDPRPVLPRTHREAVASIRAAAAWLNGMADHVEQAPWADGLFSDCDKLLMDLINAAATRMVVFRATRDCGGEA